MEFHTTRTTRYTCPYCERSQWLFSLRPVATDKWVCTKCSHPFLLDTKAIMHSWLNTITFWAMFPLGLLLTVFFIVFVKADKLIWALLLGVPVTAFALALVIYVCCIPIAWIRARSIKKNADHSDRRLKTIVRDVF